MSVIALWTNHVLVGKGSSVNEWSTCTHLAANTIIMISDAEGCSIGWFEYNAVVTFLHFGHPNDNCVYMVLVPITLVALTTLLQFVRVGDICRHKACLIIGSGILLLFIPAYASALFQVNFIQSAFIGCVGMWNYNPSITRLVHKKACCSPWLGLLVCEIVHLEQWLSME